MIPKLVPEGKMINASPESLSGLWPFCTSLEISLCLVLWSFLSQE
jgi:hypothetical protein